MRILKSLSLGLLTWFLSGCASPNSSIDGLKSFAYADSGYHIESNYYSNSYLVVVHPETKELDENGRICEVYTDKNSQATPTKRNTLHNLASRWLKFPHQ